MEKMLKAMLNVQKEIALEEDALLVDLWNIAGALQEATEILQDLISKGNFEEAKGFLNDCSQLKQKQEHFEALLADMRSDYDALEDMIKEAKQKALSLLNYMDRTESQLRQKLKEKSFTNDVIDADEYKKRKANK